MKEFSKYIKRIKSSLSYLEENVDEFKNIEKNIKTIEKLERQLKICRMQSIENETAIEKSINDINKLLLNKNGS